MRRRVPISDFFKMPIILICNDVCGQLAGVSMAV